MGAEDVQLEYEAIVQAPILELDEGSNRPQLVISIVLLVYQQFTGMNTIIFYASVLFQASGFKTDASLMSAMIIGIVCAQMFLHRLLLGPFSRGIYKVPTLSITGQSSGCYFFLVKYPSTEIWSARVLTVAVVRFSAALLSFCRLALLLNICY